MPEPAESAAGSIYDLGYRHYEGARLGRRHAVLSLYIHSLRGVFGFGRHTSSKIIPIGLTIVALLPAVIQLGWISMTKDTIVDEVRSARQRLFDACHEDLSALLDRYAEQEKLDQERIVSEIPPKAEQKPGVTRQRRVESARPSGD